MEDKEYKTVINPKSKRFIRHGGALHKKLIRNGDMPNTITVTRKKRKKKPIKKLVELDLYDEEEYYTSSSKEKPKPRRRKKFSRVRNDRRKQISNR